MIDLVFRQGWVVRALSSFEGTRGLPGFFDKSVVGETGREIDGPVAQLVRAHA